MSLLRHLKFGSTTCHCTTNKWFMEFNPHLFPPLSPPFADSMPATLIYNCFQRVSGTPPSGLCSDPPHHLECFPFRYLIHSPPSSLFKFHLGNLSCPMPIISMFFNLHSICNWLIYQNLHTCIFLSSS